MDEIERAKKIGEMAVRESQLGRTQAMVRQQLRSFAYMLLLDSEQLWAVRKDAQKQLLEVIVKLPTEFGLIMEAIAETDRITEEFAHDSAVLRVEIGESEQDL